MKVFIDQCVISNADTMTGVRLNGVAGYIRRDNPDSFSCWKKNEYECLPSIGNLIHSGSIEPFTYGELWLENSKRKTFPRSLIGELIKVPSTNHVKPPIERGYFFQSDIQLHISRAQMVQFCAWLNELNEENLVQNLSRRNDIPIDVIGAIKDLARYRELCEGLSPKQYPDAYHLWTAERAGMTHFLTMDKKFINAMRESKPISLPCMPLPPSEILRELQINSRSKFPFDIGKFYSLEGQYMASVE